MLGTVIRLLTGGSDLLGAEARLLVVRLARVAMAAGVFLLLAIVGGAAIITLGAGAAGALAHEIGWPLALVSVGGAALIFVAVAALAVGLSLKRAFRPVERSDAKASPVPPNPAASTEPDDSSDSQVASARRDIIAAKRRLHRALYAGRSRAGAAPGADSLREWALKALETAVRNPDAVLAGTFAIATVVGPTRVFRFISRAAGAVSMAATLSRIVKRELAAARAASPATPHAAPAAPAWSHP